MRGGNSKCVPNCFPGSATYRLPAEPSTADGSQDRIWCLSPDLLISAFFGSTGMKTSRSLLQCLRSLHRAIATRRSVANRSSPQLSLDADSRNCEPMLLAPSRHRHQPEGRSSVGMCEPDFPAATV